MSEREELIRQLTASRDETRLLYRLGLVVVALVVLALLVGVGGLFLLAITSGTTMADGCASEIMQDKSSPDGAYNAFLFERNCGAMDGYSTHVSIVPAGSPLLEKRGNVFQMRDHPDWNNVTLTWDGDRALRITHNGGGAVPFEEPLYQDVSIRIEAVE